MAKKTQKQTQTQNRSFDFFGTATYANKALLADLSKWALMGVGPWLLTLAIYFIVYALSLGTIADAGHGTSSSLIHSLLNLVLGVTSLVVTTILTIRIVRNVILGEIPPNPLSLKWNYALEWNQRHWKFCGFLLAFVLVLLLFTVLPIIAFQSILGVILSILGIAATVYILGRCILFVVCVAVDSKSPLTTALQLTEGGWTWLKLAGVCIVALIPSVVLFGLFEYMLAEAISHTAAFFFSALFTDFVLTYIGAFALAFCYQQLSGEKAKVRKRQSFSSLSEGRSS